MLTVLCGIHVIYLNNIDCSIANIKITL